MAEGDPPPPPPPQEQQSDNGPDGSAPPSHATTPPPPPVPASDPRLNPQTPVTPDNDPPASPQLAAQGDDIFEVSPVAALKLLGAEIEALVRLTGDIPPTPPSSTSYMPNMRGMQAEKENIVRSHSEKNLARLMERAAAAEAGGGGLPGSPLARSPSRRSPQKSPQRRSPQRSPTRSPRRRSPRKSPLKTDGGMGGMGLEIKPMRPPLLLKNSQPSLPAIDGVQLRPSAAAAAAGAQDLVSPNPSASALTPTSTPEPYIVIGADSQPLNLQHSAITRKFYSKKPPPIGIGDYLLRIHRFCPMSTAVYLATGLYIHRLAVTERAVAVTRRNAHRLLLAGLRVAMKALEDLSYPHAKIAKVGGVSDAELARLEISFCFLTGFELVVREEEMRAHWVRMRRESLAGRLDGPPVLGELRLERRPKNEG